MKTKNTGLPRADRRLFLSMTFQRFLHLFTPEFSPARPTLWNLFCDGKLLRQNDKESLGVGRYANAKFLS